MRTLGPETIGGTQVPDTGAAQALVRLSIEVPVSVPETGKPQRKWREKYKQHYKQK